MGFKIIFASRSYSRPLSLISVRATAFVWVRERYIHCNAIKLISFCTRMYDSYELSLNNKFTWRYKISNWFAETYEVPSCVQAMGLAQKIIWNYAMALLRPLLEAGCIFYILFIYIIPLFRFGNIIRCYTTSRNINYRAIIPATEGGVKRDLEGTRKKNWTK